MNTLTILAALSIVFLSVSAQQWTPQQLAAYRQQYYNWWYNQQRMQQVQQAPATQAPAPAASGRHPIWGDAQSDAKGNYWHGDDNAKFLWVARTSWP